jgi:hypothetical protein
MLQKIIIIFFGVALRAGLSASSPHSFTVAVGFSLQSLTQIKQTSFLIIFILQVA